MKRLLSVMAAALLSVAAIADTLDVKSFKFIGPISVPRPLQIDSLDNNGKAFSLSDLLECQVAFDRLRDAAAVDSLPRFAGDAAAPRLAVAGFSIENRSFLKAEVKVEGLNLFKLYLDGKPISVGTVKLEPATHEFTLKYVASTSDSASRVRIITPAGKPVALRTDGKKLFSLDVNTIGEGGGAVSLSPSGKFVAVSHSFVAADGKRSSWTEILQTNDSKVLLRTRERIKWMPRSDCYYYTRQCSGGLGLYCANPLTGEEKCLSSSIPAGNFTVSPTEDFLIFELSKTGPKEGEVHEILHPDDRQPGWRDRGYLSRFDLASGVQQTLTFGWHDTWLCDISDDGTKILYGVRSSHLTERPTSRDSYYIMDLATLGTQCIIDQDGFIAGHPQFSPGGNLVLVQGTPEAFGRVGCILGEDKIPNEFEYELFLLTVSDRSVKPLTKDLDPSITSAQWSRYDGKIYAIAEDKDTKVMYRIDPARGVAEKLPCSEEYVYGLSLSVSSPQSAYWGQSLCGGQNAYLMDTYKLKQKKLCDFCAGRLADVQLGRGDAFEFTNSRGDRINGFYVLPPDFDPHRKYPMIVHYYGGCSPTTRYCIGSYSPQMYAAQDYVFYVVNPSGAAGFGQEFASRHVNTAGEGVAEDIIEGTLAFCREHPYVDSTRVGCFSASYGGFMTQLLLSKTDLYRTGISHAGISDHTSYWGEGYWGYSYSETSMAGSYPWTRKDLYVDRSPLYFADKINTPLLLLHGSADTNVPIGESIQMYTALKLLGRETAFVVVDGENHGISDFAKRRQWLRTIQAWFAKYLKDDPTWWNELYPGKKLD